MLAILAKIFLQPTSVAPCLKAAESILMPTRLEAEYTHYAFARCIENPTVLRITGKSNSQQALQDHLKSPHITSFLDQIKTMGMLSVQA